MTENEELARPILDHAGALSRVAAPHRVTLYGAECRAARERRGLTLAAVARLVRCSGSYIHDLENARRPPAVGEKRERLAVALGVDIVELDVLAAADAGVYRLPALSPLHDRGGRLLMRRWADLGPDELAAIVAIVESRDGAMRRARAQSLAAAKEGE